MNIKEEFIKYLEESNKDIPKNELTTGKLIMSLLDFRTNVPVKIMMGDDELQVDYIGCSPYDDSAWADNNMELPNNASMFEIQVHQPEENIDK